MSWDIASFFAGLITGIGLLAFVLLMIERERQHIADYEDEHANLHE